MTLTQKIIFTAATLAALALMLFTAFGDSCHPIAVKNGFDNCGGKYWGGAW